MEAGTSSRDITLDDLIDLQTSSGSFIPSKAAFRLRLLCHFSPKVIEKTDQYLQDAIDWARWSVKKMQHTAIRDTVLIIVFIKVQYPISTKLWELVILKARVRSRG